MSRGLGRIEQSALRVLEAGELMSPLEIAARAEHVAVVSEAVYRSYARALRTLARKGLIQDVGRHFRHGSKRYALPDAATAYEARVRTVFGEQPTSHDERRPR
jgi:hypothetical protein